MWMDSYILNQPLSTWLKIGQQETHRALWRFFASQQKAVVLARSNKPELEVEEERCHRAGVPILRRKGGGGTVVLGDGCLIFTMAFYAKELFANDTYFAAVNDIWIEALKSIGIEGVRQRGISDLAVGDKKIAGTSLFRKRHLLVYQGSLLVNPDLEQISWFLRHPTKEPDYRQGRKHSEFITSLKELGHDISPENLAQVCERFMQKKGLSFLEPHFIDEKTFEKGGLSFW